VTAVAYDLPRAGDVRIDVFDVRGRHVRTLVATSVPAGRYRVAWDGTDSRGRRVAAGAYLCRMRAEAFEAVRRLVLVP
jgi:flagellar hook assembly protein FlgD